VEFESADDFVLSKETVIDHASFTGLLTGGATPRDLSDVVVEIYLVFPLDSNLTRTPHVPTRANSPSDVAFRSLDSADKQLNFHAEVLNVRFTAQASVFSAARIGVNSGGNGPVTGQEVEFDVEFGKHALDLPAGHYFFVPQVGLSARAPAGSHFLWLSAPKPITPAGMAFPPGATDPQSWMRDDPPLAPDWLRVGTDVIERGAPPTFTTWPRTRPPRALLMSSRRWRSGSSPGGGARKGVPDRDPRTRTRRIPPGRGRPPDHGW
jgi:hypothetical protein